MSTDSSGRQSRLGKKIRVRKRTVAVEDADGFKIMFDARSAEREREWRASFARYKGLFIAFALSRVPSDPLRRTMRQSLSAPAALRISFAILDIVALLVPRRLRDEEIGDALEDMHDLRAEGAPAWRIHVKTFSTVFWIAVNAIREVTSGLLGKKSKS